MQEVFERREDRYFHIDGLRAIAVIWMVGFHSIWYLGFFVSKDTYFSILMPQQHFRLLLDGLLAVDLFFTLSGFLITSILLREIANHGSVRFGSFYIRRFFRIIPAYLVSLMLCRYILGGSRVENVWANLLLVNNYISTGKQFMGWAWSLAIEEQFYLFFPLFLVALFKVSRRPGLTIFFILFGSLGFRYFTISRYGLQELLPFTPFFDTVGFSRWFDNWYDKTHLRGGGILVGVLAAFLNSDSGFKTYFISKRKYAVILLLFGATYFAWSITSEQTCVFDYCSKNNNASYRVLYETLKHFMTSLITAGLILYCAGPGSPGIINRLLSSKIWRPFAEVSFSAYLLHPLIIVVFYSSLFATNPQPSQSTLGYYLILVELLTFGISFIMHFLIEAPSRRLGRRIVAKALAPPIP